MNKRILMIVCLFSAFVSHAQDAYKGKGDTKMHVGANFQNGGTGIVTGLQSLGFAATTSFTGLTFYPSSGTITGNIRVYGLKN